MANMMGGDLRARARDAMRSAKACPRCRLVGPSAAFWAVADRCDACADAVVLAVADVLRAEPTVLVPSAEVQS